MNLGVLLMRAPGAETPTPILGYQYSFGSIVRVAPPSDSVCPQFWGQRTLIWNIWRCLIDSHRCWKTSNPPASNTNTPELGSAFQRRGRALARLPILNLSKFA